MGRGYLNDMAGHAAISEDSRQDVRNLLTASAKQPVILHPVSGGCPYLPYSLGGELGQDAMGTILQIMASGMLAVTTFSLTAMVSAYSSATQLATPRATQLLISDPTSQSALSTFLGAFVFSIVGIIGLQTHAYGSDGRIILRGATVLIVAWVVVTLLRRIAHITAFRRMPDVIDRVENAAADAMTAFAATPYRTACRTARCQSMPCPSQAARQGMPRIST